MEKKSDDLRQIRGVGKIIAARLGDAGFDSFAKIVSSGEEGLKGIKGLHAQARAAILKQAIELAKEVEVQDHSLHERAIRLTGLVNALAARTSHSYGSNLHGSFGEKVERQFLKITSLLDAAQTKADSRKRLVARCLAKVEKRLATVNEQHVKDLYKGLRKIRKALKKIGVV